MRAASRPPVRRSARIAAALVALCAVALATPAPVLAAEGRDGHATGARRHAAIATTGPAVVVDANAVRLSATVNPSGRATRAHFEFGRSAALGRKAPTHALGASKHAARVSDSIAGLDAGGTYYFRVVAVNASGTVTGATRTIVVPDTRAATATPATAPPAEAPVVAQPPAVQVPPTVSTPPVVALPAATTGTPASGSAGWSVTGSVDAGNGATTVWAEYGTTTAYGATSGSATLAGGTGAVSVRLVLGALQPSAAYHVRLVARNAAGTAYGADASFSTPAVPAGLFVSTTGDDTADGSFTRPWRTLQHAANVVAPGATVWLRGGAYAGFSMTRSGAPGSPITFAGFDGETAVLTPPAGTNVVDISNAHDIVLRGLTIQGATGVYDAGVMIRNGAANVTVTGSTLQANHSFGIRLYNATAATITDNLITHNDTGIQVNFLGEGTVVAGNQIAANDGMVVNDATPGNDNGANGIQFVKSTGHITVTGNTIHGNRAPSHDYGYDGGAFEIFAASNVTMDSNTLWDNQNVVETGTDGNHTPCAGNVFTHNIAYGGNDKSLVSPWGPVANGLLLRCASNMLIANNTLADLDFWTYDVSQSSSYSGGIDGLTIVNNVNLQHADKVYAIEVPLPPTDVIDHNVDFNEGGGNLASVAGYGNTSSLADLTAWTGVDANGVFADPEVADEAGRDFHLASGSPALQSGTAVSGVTDGGSTPNVGRY